MLCSSYKSTVIFIISTSEFVPDGDLYTGWEIYISTLGFVKQLGDLYINPQI